MHPHTRSIGVLVEYLREVNKSTGRHDVFIIREDGTWDIKEESR